MIDPRHEQTTPSADVPYWARGYDLAAHDTDRDANHEFACFVVRMIMVGVIGVVAAFTIAVASMIFAWGAEMPKGPFLDGPQYNPYGTPAIKKKYAASPLKPWFDGLKSGKGLCCSFADGVKIEDVDWDTKGGHYRVRLDGKWVVVPAAALVTEPNKFGPAVVWPFAGADGSTQIRCFLPGAGS